MDDVKMVGACTVCDASVFEILTVFPDGHSLAGENRSIGRPNDNAVRVSLVLTDGSTIDLTACEGCVEELENTLPAVWLKCLNTFKHEDRTRVERGVQSFTGDQRQTHVDMLTRLALEIPLGIMNIRKWTDAYHQA